MHMDLGVPECLLLCSVMLIYTLLCWCGILACDSPFTHIRYPILPGTGKHNCSSNNMLVIFYLYLLYEYDY